MPTNYKENVIIPEGPKVTSKEQMFLYVPLASNTIPGIASFYRNHFTVINGEVKINQSYIRSLFDEYSQFETYLNQVIEYSNTSQSFAEQSGTEAERSRVEAERSRVFAEQSKADSESIVKYVENSKDFSRQSELYALGTRDGVLVPEYEQRNSKYWANQAFLNADAAKKQVSVAKQYTKEFEELKDLAYKYSNEALQHSYSAYDQYLAAKLQANAAELQASAAEESANEAKSYLNVKLISTEDASTYKYDIKLVKGDGETISSVTIDLPLEASILRVDDKIITNELGEEELGLKFYLQDGTTAPSQHDTNYPEGYYPVSKILSGIVHAEYPKDSNYYYVYGQEGREQQFKAVTLYGLKADGSTPNSHTIPMRGAYGELYTRLTPEHDYETISKKYFSDTLSDITDILRKCVIKDEYGIAEIDDIVVKNEISVGVYTLFTGSSIYTGQGQFADRLAVGDDEEVLIDNTGIYLGLDRDNPITADSNQVPDGREVYVYIEQQFSVLYSSLDAILAIQESLIGGNS